MPPKKMEAKVAALESEVASLCSVLVTMQSKAKENQAKLLTLLEERLSLNEGEKSVMKTSLNVIVDEFHQAVKKVELPLFIGEDPTRWIARVEIYFQIQETHLEIREFGPTMYRRLDDSFFQVVTGRQDKIHVEETQSRIARAVREYRRRGCVCTTRRTPTNRESR